MVPDDLRIPVDEPLYLDCGEHGKRIATVVCQHLLNVKDRAVGFVENCSQPNDRQAWCHSCEECFREEGQMSEVLKDFCNASLVCEYCYELFKSRHTV